MSMYRDAASQWRINMIAPILYTFQFSATKNKLTTLFATASLSQSVLSPDRNGNGFIRATQDPLHLHIEVGHIIDSDARTVIS